MDGKRKLPCPWGVAGVSGAVVTTGEASESPSLLSEESVGETDASTRLSLRVCAPTLFNSEGTEVDARKRVGFIALSAACCWVSGWVGIEESDAPCEADLRRKAAPRNMLELAKVCGSS